MKKAQKVRFLLEKFANCCKIATLKNNKLKIGEFDNV